MSSHRGQPQRIGDALWPSCPRTGKVIHPTEQAARDHAASWLIRDGGRMAVYRCTGRGSCGGWHIGHRGRGSGRKGRRG